MTISVTQRSLRAALVDAWKSNLKERHKHRGSVDYPKTPEEAKLSLPALYEVWVNDYEAMGGVVDWETI